MDSVFDIPLLLDEISQYLSQTDLQACVRVSKIWSMRFIPILWRTLDLKNCGQTHRLFNFNWKHTHIRTIKSGSLWFFEALAGLHRYKHPFHFHSPNLRSIKWTYYFPDKHKPGSDDLVLDFFKAHSTLQDISLRFNIITPALIATLDKRHLPSLKSFSFIGGKKIENDTTVQQLIHACAWLETLKIEVSHEEDIPKKQNANLYQKRKTIMESMPTTRLRKLSIDLYCPFQEAVTLVPLLRKSPLLQDLRIFSSPGNNTSVSIAAALREEGCCPELKTLTIKQEGITDNELAELVNACTSSLCPSKSYESSLTRATFDKVHRDFKSLTVISKACGPLTACALTQDCAQSLVALDIGQYKLIYLGNFITLVSNLPGLQKLFVGRIYFVSLAQGGKNSLVKALDTPWVCRDLKCLGFRLSWSNVKELFLEDDSDSEGNGFVQYAATKSTGGSDTDDVTDLADFKSRCLDCFWDRVAELGNLRYLWYESNEFPLLPRPMESVFYLDRLRSLKKIQTLHIDRDILGVKEAAWFLQYWPDLSRITGLKREHAEMCHCRSRSLIWICTRPLEDGEGMTELKTGRPWIIMD
ncbi:hypothetical protein BGX21_007466 [Mortierella sp. AD011]|nr:hypothetical protein BGX20_010922 [Mortierella sp. AD010]KAF9398649.1 hypothetical protein BGX21_007466 [Mortierella sp. AD011]